MDPNSQPPSSQVSQNIPPSNMVVPSPAAAQVTPSAMSQDQMRQSLQSLMSKIDSKYQDFNSHKFSSTNKLQEIQSQTLRALFDLLQSAGVDPSNPQQVQSFLDKINQQNPELYQQLVQVLQSLLGSDNSSPIQGDSEVPNNMNINPNEDLQKNL